MEQYRAQDEHWRCPDCGTLDGPITVRACDVCADEGRAVDVEALVPASQLEGAVSPDDEAAIDRAERWILHEMHEGMSNREVAVGVLRAAGGR